MRLASGMVVLLLVPGLALAAATEKNFTVVTGGNKVGDPTATRDGDRVAINYDVKNNGRGRTTAETLVPGGSTADLKAIKTIRALVKDGAVYYPA